ncbi:hypothetical protein PsYK624_095670 [Phanerochaete sordida]|uniref:Uncharacterized protein n=1 Tax=Phanerochaete sordida TaxID=48140 RepID=A0A9P3GC61_9APHY|nr:hypothetical protein PsYK624_095670 [Phanerochaete sordida]
MAVGKSNYDMFYGGIQPGASLIWSGFLMANDCKLIAQNGGTQAQDQMCRGGWNPKVANIECDSNGNPTGAVDTQGQHWHCSPTNDGSCNRVLEGSFNVLACCDRG